jgi:hypothetical protein
MEQPFATVTIKVFEHKDQETTIEWAAIATDEQRAKLTQALEDNLKLLRRYPQAA